jgi:hypothetical protein
MAAMTTMLRIEKKAEDGDWDLTCQFCGSGPFQLPLETEPSWDNVINDHARWPEDGYSGASGIADPEAAQDAEEWVPACEKRTLWTDTEWILRDSDGYYRTGTIKVNKAKKTISVKETSSN